MYNLVIYCALVCLACASGYLLSTGIMNSPSGMRYTKKIATHPYRSLKMSVEQYQEIEFNKIVSIKRLRAGFQTSILAFGLSSLSPMPTLADTDTSNALTAYNKIQQVESSIKYIQQDIENGGDATAIIKEVKILLNNFKLRENVATSLPLVPSNNRDKASALGKEAYEDLVQITEYYPDNVDDLSGSRTPPQEVLTFAQMATGSADQKLKAMLQLFPQNLASSD